MSKSMLFNQEEPKLTTTKGKQAKAPRNAPKDASQVFHQDMITAWVSTYQLKTGLTPLLIPKELRNLKLIRQAIYSQAAEMTPTVFQQILSNWHTLPKWYQDNFSLSIIYCKINEILNLLKNGNSTTPQAITSTSVHQKLDQLYRQK